MNRIEVTEQTLTDGSKTYNVAISEMTLHAIDQRAAETIAETLKALIDVRTVDQVAVRFDY